MAFLDLYGIGNQAIAWFESESTIPTFSNIIVTSITPTFREVRADFRIGNLIKPGFAFVRGNFDINADGSISGGVVNEYGIGTDDGYIVAYIENINITVDELFATGGDKEALNQLEAKLLSGDDVLRGSVDGGSVKARMLGGNDFVEIFGGNDNDVNGNLGADTFELFGGGGRIRGGSEGDTINLYDGFYYVVNGNKGEDILTNYAEFGNNIRGGSDGDLLINRNGLGVFYGDSGSDTFLPFDSGDSSTYMVVKDFEVGIDQIDLSAVGVFEAFFDPGTDSTIFYTVTNDNVSVFASVEGVDIA
jgi:hypothetical protein